METHIYLEKLKNIHYKLLEYLECIDDSEENFQNIINYFEKNKILGNRYELKLFLHLFSKIANNHNRQHRLFEKIEKILLFYKNQIKQSYSNFEIFDIFKGNKKIVLFLINENMIKIDEQISSILLSSRYNYMKYSEYFYPELKPFFPEDHTFSIDGIENFEEKRKIGENDSYVCFLIRNDFIDEFITFVNRINLPLNSKIQKSIFETNKFLLANDPTLIEYAIFFGSIQIFQYLRLNSIKPNSYFWQYAIHGKNADLIHLLEEDQIKPAYDSYDVFYKESIKCHHNDITNYIQNNFNVKKDEEIKSYFFESVSYCFRYYNYEFIPSGIDYQSLFYYACYYDYYNLVGLLLNSQKVELNRTTKDRNI
ncbi:hypothetical protein M9Y10_025987 [Tritrichomonas musculus]|uniref:DUF3447 domain-containing protein n=1 Tax=Tritrichomonas musculus TaxID=1915356 RepID=A0ABR2H883_9EUKA